MPQLPPNSGLPADPCERLAVVGALLFGRRWQTRMAAACGVSRQTIDNWYRCRRPPEDLDRHLLDVVSREIGRVRELDGLKNEIRARMAAESMIETPAPKVRSRRLTLADLNYLDPQVRAIAAEYLDLLPAK